MYYLQAEFQARERQQELLREARELRIAGTLEPRKHDGGVLEQLYLRRLAGLLKREPEYEVLSEVFDEDEEIIPRPSEHSKAAGAP